MKRVLVIEDQKPVRDAIGELLKAADLEPKLIGDGAAALEELRGKTYDLVTLDLNMPSLDGVSIMEALSADEGPNAKTPVIVISAYLTRDIENDLRELGVGHFLGKPFDADDLISAVSSLTEKDAK